MSEDSCYHQMPAFLQGSYGIRHELFIIIIASKTHPKKKKITQNKSMNKKKKNSEFTHLNGNTYKY